MPHQHKAAPGAGRRLQTWPTLPQQIRRRGEGPHGREDLKYMKFRHPPRKIPCMGLEGLLHRAREGERDRVQRRTREPCEIQESHLRGKAWDQDAQLHYLSMKKLGRIWSISEKRDGIEAPSSLEARFRDIYVSLDRDMKPD